MRPAAGGAAGAALALVLTLAATVAVPRAAYAQDPSIAYDPAFSVERLTPPPGPGVFVQVEDGDVAGRGEVTVGATLSVLTRPLIVRHVQTGEVLSEPVRTRTGLDLGVAVGVGRSVQVGLALPVVLHQSGDRLRGLDLPGGDGGLAATTIGDLRVSGKLRIVDPEHGLGQAWGVAFTLTLPTGDDLQFAGEAGTVVEFHLIGSWRAPDWAVAANLGPRFRTQEVPFLSPEVTLGNELTWGAAASARAPWWPRLEGLVEVAGARGDEGVSPAEARTGVRWRVRPAWTVGVIVGVGISGSDDIGAPGFRSVLDVRWAPSSRIDSDRDGVADGEDGCPREPEDQDGFEDADGCVDPDDDGDGIADGVDACPDMAEDRDRFLDDDGCPEADNDKDRVLDDVDVCPNDPDDRCPEAQQSVPEEAAPEEGGPGAPGVPGVPEVPGAPAPGVPAPTI